MSLVSKDYDNILDIAPSENVLIEPAAKRQKTKDSVAESPTRSTGAYVSKRSRTEHLDFDCGKAEYYSSSPASAVIAEPIVVPVGDVCPTVSSPPITKGSMKKVLEWKSHAGAVCCLRWSPCGKYFVSASMDKQAIVWEPFHAPGAALKLSFHQGTQ